VVNYKVILNPAAGGGSGARASPRVEQLLKEHGLQYDFVRTERPWHAVEISRESALTGYDVVVAAGGDGTTNEVINGLMKAKLAGGPSVPLGVLCVGRGNDFTSTVDIPEDLELGIQNLVRGHLRAIDIGLVAGGQYPQGRYFGNCVGVGFDAIGTIEAAKLPRLGGFLSYFIAVLKTIFLYNLGPLIEVNYDGQTLTRPSLLISVMNGRRLGGGFNMASDAHPDDGLFDLCMAGEVSRARMFALIPHFMRGTQATQDVITTARAASVSITALEGSLPAQTDGEILCVDGQQLEINLLHREIEVICPPQT
jgi:YegS/Rv2252/BmrU family lipid kinase